MGETSVPQWMRVAYIRSMEAIGSSASKELLQQAYQELIECWSQKRRHFHNLSHLSSILQHLDSLSSSTHDIDLVRIAAWYHGIVFNDSLSDVSRRMGGEDAEASAQLAATKLAQLGVPKPNLERVQDLILKLRRGADLKTDIDAQVLCDAEFSVLAAIPQDYRAYRDLIRREYSHVTEKNYTIGRLKIVASLLSRPAIFTSPLGASWESAARQNLEGEFARLAGRLPEFGFSGVEEVLEAAPKDVSNSPVKSRVGADDKGAITDTGTLIIKAQTTATPTQGVKRVEVATKLLRTPPKGTVKILPKDEGERIKEKEKAAKEKKVDADDNVTSTLESAIDTFE